MADLQIAIVARQPDRHPVPPLDPPAKGQRRQRLPQRLQAAHSLISTNGTEGASPAAKVARLMSSRSSAQRTGTSTRKPAVSTAPSAGATSKAITPSPENGGASCRESGCQY